jgi:hypothetical protein
VSFCSCLLVRGYASAATGTLIRQSSHSALHLFVEEVSPVIHHRLKQLWLLAGGTSGHGMHLSNEVTATFATRAFLAVTWAMLRKTFECFCYQWLSATRASPLNSTCCAKIELRRQ